MSPRSRDHTPTLSPSLTPTPASPSPTVSSLAPTDITDISDAGPSHSGSEGMTFAPIPTEARTQTDLVAAATEEDIEIDEDVIDDEIDVETGVDEDAMQPDELPPTEALPPFNAHAEAEAEAPSLPPKPHAMASEPVSVEVDKERALRQQEVFVDEQQQQASEPAPITASIEADVIPAPSVFGTSDMDAEIQQVMASEKYERDVEPLYAVPSVSSPAKQQQPQPAPRTPLALSILPDDELDEWQPVSLATDKQQQQVSEARISAKPTPIPTPVPTPLPFTFDGDEQSMEEEIVELVDSEMNTAEVGPAATAAATATITTAAAVVTVAATEVQPAVETEIESGKHVDEQEKTEVQPTQAAQAQSQASVLMGDKRAEPEIPVDVDDGAATIAEVEPAVQTQLKEPVTVADAESIEQHITVMTPSTKSPPMADEYAVETVQAKPDLSATAPTVNEEVEIEEQVQEGEGVEEEFDLDLDVPPEEPLPPPPIPPRPNANATTSATQEEKDKPTPPTPPAPRVLAAASTIVEKEHAPVKEETSEDASQLHEEVDAEQKKKDTRPTSPPIPPQPTLTSGTVEEVEEDVEVEVDLEEELDLSAPPPTEPLPVFTPPPPPPPMPAVEESKEEETEHAPQQSVQDVLPITDTAATTELAAENENEVPTDELATAATDTTAAPTTASTEYDTAAQSDSNAATTAYADYSAHGYYDENGQWVAYATTDSQTGVDGAFVAAAYATTSEPYYDETSGRYYDPASGCYWNDETHAWEYPTAYDQQQEQQSTSSAYDATAQQHYQQPAEESDPQATVEEPQPQTQKDVTSGDAHANVIPPANVEAEADREEVDEEIGVELELEVEAEQAPSTDVSHAEMSQTHEESVESASVELKPEPTADEHGWSASLAGIAADQAAADAAEAERRAEEIRQEEQRRAGKGRRKAERPHDQPSTAAAAETEVKRETPTTQAEVEVTQPSAPPKSESVQEVSEDLAEESQESEQEQETASKSQEKEALVDAITSSLLRDLTRESLPPIAAGSKATVEAAPTPSTVEAESEDAAAQKHVSKQTASVSDSASPSMSLRDSSLSSAPTSSPSKSSIPTIPPLPLHTIMRTPPKDGSSGVTTPSKSLSTPTSAHSSPALSPRGGPVSESPRDDRAILRTKSLEMLGRARLMQKVAERDHLSPNEAFIAEERTALLHAASSGGSAASSANSSPVVSPRIPQRALGMAAMRRDGASTSSSSTSPELGAMNEHSHTCQTLPRFPLNLSGLLNAASTLSMSHPSSASASASPSPGRSPTASTTGSPRTMAAIPASSLLARLDEKEKGRDTKEKEKEKDADVITRKLSDQMVAQTTEEALAEISAARRRKILQQTDHEELDEEVDVDGVLESSTSSITSGSPLASSSGDIQYEISHEDLASTHLEPALGLGQAPQRQQQPQRYDSSGSYDDSFKNGATPQDSANTSLEYSFDRDMTEATGATHATNNKEDEWGTGEFEVRHGDVESGEALVTEEISDDDHEKETSAKAVEQTTVKPISTSSSLSALAETEEDEDMGEYSEEAFDEFALDTSATNLSATLAQVAAIPTTTTTTSPAIITDEHFVRKYLRSVVQVYQSERNKPDWDPDTDVELVDPSIDECIHAAGGHKDIRRVPEDIFVSVERDRAYFNRSPNDPPGLPRSFPTPASSSSFPSAAPSAAGAPFPLESQQVFHKLLFDRLNECIAAYRSYWATRKREPWFAAHQRTLGNVLDTATRATTGSLEGHPDGSDADDEIEEGDNDEADADPPPVHTHVRHHSMENGFYLSSRTSMPSRHTESLDACYARLIDHVVHGVNRMRHVSSSTPSMHTALTQASEHARALTAGLAGSSQGAPPPNVKVPTTAQSIVEYEMKIVENVLKTERKGERDGGRRSTYKQTSTTQSSPSVAVTPSPSPSAIPDRDSPSSSDLDLSSDSSAEWSTFESRSSIRLVNELADALFDDLLLNMALDMDDMMRERSKTTTKRRK